VERNHGLDSAATTENMSTALSEKEEDRREREHFIDVLSALACYMPFMMNEVVRRKRHFERLSNTRLERLPGGAKGATSVLDNMIRAVHQNSAFLHHICLNPNSYHDAFRTSQHEWDMIPAVVAHMQRIRTAKDLDAKKVFKYAGKPHHMAKVKGTLHQCYREWSAAGSLERKQAFFPLIEQLQKHMPVTSQNKNQLRVLVPGCGLGRLVLEICSRGYATQGNEFDYFMLLTCNLLLNGTDRKNMYSIFPWIERRCNVYNRADVFRPVTFPDVCPADLVSKNPGYDMSMCAGEFLEVYKSHTECWDAVVACFFLDTAPNIFTYLETIHRMLKPGGILTSIGPLMYHWASGTAAEDTRYGESIELSYDELRHVVESYGFRILHEERRVCQYAVCPGSMLQTSYNAVLFTAKKKERIDPKTQTASDSTRTAFKP